MANLKSFLDLINPNNNFGYNILLFILLVSFFCLHPNLSERMGTIVSKFLYRTVNHCMKSGPAMEIKK